MRSALCGVAALALLAGCTPAATGIVGDVTSAVQKDILTISKTAAADLVAAQTTAATPVVKADGTTAPVDPHGATCYAGLIVVNKNAMAVLAASPGGGLITQAEIATIFAPESPAFQDAKSQIFTSCFAKFQDVQTAVGAVANPALLFSMLPVIAPALAPLSGA